MVQELFTVVEIRGKTNKKKVGRNELKPNSESEKQKTKIITFSFVLRVPEPMQSLAKGLLTNCQAPSGAHEANGP